MLCWSPDARQLLWSRREAIIFSAIVALFIDIVQLEHYSSLRPGYEEDVASRWEQEVRTEVSVKLSKS